VIPVVLKFKPWVVASAGCGLAVYLASPPVGAGADHHLHLFSPVLADLLESRARGTDPELAALLDPVAFKTRSVEEVLSLLDESGLERGVLLSGAYMFSSPLLEDLDLDVPGLVRQENTHNVQAAASSGGRLVAFVGINPLEQGSLEELAFWVSHGGIAGIKLHLANSGFNFADPEHVRRLSAVFSAAADADLAVVVHLRSGPVYGAEEAQAFVDRVLPAAADIPVQLAHGGGWGGLDQGTLDALEVYVAAMERGAAGSRQLVIDLAMLTLGEETPLALREHAAALIRRAGLVRFVMGSDWPAVFRPQAHEAYLRQQLPLSDQEWDVIVGNKAPYLLTP